MKQLLLTLTVIIFVGKHAISQEISDKWRYTFRKPADSWTTADFQPKGWKEGNGGFGTHGTPASRIGTVWGTPNIWLRKEFNLASIPAKPALLVHHDENCQIYVNGKKFAELTGYSVKYDVVPVDAESAKALKVGKNTMAVHCHQTGGGQFIDVHLVDSENIPQLPPPIRDTKPFESSLITQWGSAVQPDNVWREYPRPQLRRENWQCLNGHWDYAITDLSQASPPTQWAGKILVPFCLESKLGGVHRLLSGTEALWYHRTFTLPAQFGRQILNFEAVDYRCEVFVNGKSVGKHQGGHTPFALDITSAAKSGENSLMVRVEDETEKFQLRGKQVLNAHGIWYTQVSGIWQTVWLEQVPENYIEQLKLTTDAQTGQIEIRAIINGVAAGCEVVVKDGGNPIVQGRSSKANESVKVIVPKDKLKLWSPDSPHLYDLEVRMLDQSGKQADKVDSYVGVRSVGKVKDADGHWRFTLNGKPIFHFGPLDQGWWPDGLLTPPSDDAMAFDIKWLKSAGFNMIRKHIKVEPRRYYYHCDRLGMMMWQDQVSGGVNPPWTRLQPEPRDAQWPDDAHQQFMVELERMIDNLENHPCIVCWVPFNEAWGQHKTVEVGQWTVKRDPSRHVNVASGGNFWQVGDIVDEHAYPHPVFPFDLDKGRFDGFIKVMGEYGGHGYPVPEHMWDNDRENWGYGGLPKDQAEYLQRYKTSVEKLVELKKQGIAAGVYTQTTDVEIEINGLMTYDRKVIKIPATELKRIHAVLFD